MSDTSAVAIEIVLQLFTHLPCWVNQALFMKEMTTCIEKEVVAARKNNTDVDLSYVDGILCPFVSDYIDLGASGGLSGKYNQVIFDAFTGQEQKQNH